MTYAVLMSGLIKLERSAAARTHVAIEEGDHAALPPAAAEFISGGDPATATADLLRRRAMMILNDSREQVRRRAPVASRACVWTASHARHPRSRFARSWTKRSTRGCDDSR